MDALKSNMFLFSFSFLKIDPSTKATTWAWAIGLIIQTYHQMWMTFFRSY